MLNLDFASAIPDTISDKDGEGTGFTSLLPNNNGSEYNPSRINLDTKAGTLVLTATKGSNAGSTNTLKNALSVGLDATQTFTVSTRLKGPLTNLTTAVQQGGIFFGSSQDNYAKLAVINNGSGLRIQFFKEENGSGSSVGTIAGLNWANIKTLDLFLTGDPLTKTVSAAYRVNSDTAAPIALTQNFKPSSSASLFADATKARTGILAFTKDAADVPISFDSFGIAQNVKINFQPSEAALPAGYIKDSGEAYDAARGYGWVSQDSLSSGTHTPLSVAAYARDRNRSNVEQRIDTLLHMQYPDTPAAAWEYTVPNGTYSVTVSVGDQPGKGSVYDSQHTIRVEGVTAINGFQGSATQQYQLASVKVNVTDGRLTVDAIGGTNTKINYLEIVNVTPGKHPSVPDSFPRSRATGINRDAAVIVDVSLPTVGQGVDPATLNTTNVQLYSTKDNALVPGNINTTGGGDAIVYQPSVPLKANTNYTFRISAGVTDQAGATFLPFSTTFTTGTATTPSTPGVNFSKKTVYSGAPISSLVISPDHKLYAAGLDGSLQRWTINDDGSLSNQQVFNDNNNKLSDRAIIGLTFDPNNANILWISHNDPIFPQPANDFTGKISKLTLNGKNFDAKVQDYVVGLPRASKDHLSNSLVFGPDGKLYMTQGSNSAMGAPDPGWYNRPERLLNASVLQIDPTRTPPTGGFNVQTEKYVNSSGVTTTGNYNPYATNAPVKIFATGVRNAYDLVWHSNNNLYVPTNGSAAGGNTPDNPATTVNETLTKVATQNDYLYKIPLDGGGYYGHPNPKRNEYILNGGNPTSAVDPAEVVKPFPDSSSAGYSVGIQPEPNYQGFAYDFGRNRSPNGVIEYKSDKFGGALKNKLLVVEYSGGDDILALDPGDDGNIPRGNVSKVFSGLTDPLDLIEDTRKGNLYVAELPNNGSSGGQISLLS